MIPSDHHNSLDTLARRGLIAAAAAACIAGFAAAADDVTLSLVPSRTHAESGWTLDVAVRMDVAATAQPLLIGAQVALRFDASLLEPATASMVAAVGDGPLPALNPDCAIDPVAGAICFFVLDPTFEGTNRSGELATLHFRVKPNVELCTALNSVQFANLGGTTTTLAALSDPAPTVGFIDLPPLNLDRTAPTLAGLPESIALPTDAGSAIGSVVAQPVVTAADACDPSVPVHVVVTQPNGQTIAGWPERFPIGTSTVTWSATDDTGHTATASRTVTVENHQLMDAVVHLLAGFDRESIGFERLVRFKAGSSVQLRTVSFDPITASGSVADLQVPVAAAYPCVSAKDASHSLTDTAAAAVAGTKYEAQFDLVLGDSNDDDLVDVVDFTYFVFDRGVAASDARSNFNADAQVNNADFAFISLNFFRSGERCGAFAGGQPRSSVSVKELRRMGLGHLAAADMNRDGVVDLRDMQNYMAGGGNRPALSEEQRLR